MLNEPKGCRDTPHCTSWEFQTDRSITKGINLNLQSSWLLDLASGVSYMTTSNTAEVPFHRQGRGGLTNCAHQAASVYLQVTYMVGLPD